MWVKYLLNSLSPVVFDVRTGWFTVCLLFFAPHKVQQQQQLSDVNPSNPCENIVVIVFGKLRVKMNPEN